MFRKPTRSLAVAAALMMLLGACGDDDEAADETTTSTSTTAAAGDTAASLAIVSPAPGASVGGNVVKLDLKVEGVQVVKADGDRSGRTGHFHVFVDRDPVAAGATIPREAGILHTTDNPVSITGLSPGSHRFAVVLGDGAHARIGSVEAETTVDVKGPSVDASAPATVAAGQPVPVTVKVEGLSLVKADGDTSGRTAHLHYFVDREPTAAGEAIPTGQPGITHSTETTLAIPDLAAGEHTIWVVAGNGTHVPLDPSVRDKVTVTVG